MFVSEVEIFQFGCSMNTHIGFLDIPELSTFKLNGLRTIGPRKTLIHCFNTSFLSLSKLYKLVVHLTNMKTGKRNRDFIKHLAIFCHFIDLPYFTFNKQIATFIECESMYSNLFNMQIFAASQKLQ